MTHFLRFTDEPAFHAACEAAGLWINDSNPRPLLLSHTHILDVLGPLAQVTAEQLSISDEEQTITFSVGLTADQTGWEAQLTPPAVEPGTTLTATYAVNFSNQRTGDFDSATLEATINSDSVTVNRLIFDPEDPETVTDRVPATNSTDTLGASFDAWHVNAKFTAGLPDGWDAYLVTPSSPVRVFAGDS